MTGAAEAPITPRHSVDRAPTTGTGRGARIRPADRGRLSVAERVVTKVATRAATEVPAVGGGTGVLGLRGHRLSSAPRVRVALTDNRAAVTVELGLPFPYPIRPTVSRVQQHVALRLTELTGVGVSRVDVRIVLLTAADAPSVEADQELR